MSILATQPDLEKIISKAVKRIGENHALARDGQGVEMKALEIEEDRKNFRKGRTNEVGNETMESVIEESLKAVADEMAEKMILENTIDKMVKDVIKPTEQGEDEKKEVNETTTDTIKGKINEAEEMACKIWLAGLGAYGKSVEEAQGRYEKLSEEANKMFDELVTKGETLEEDAKSKFKSTTNDVENRVADVRKKLGLDSEPADQRIEELSAKIDALTEAVAKLAASK